MSQSKIKSDGWLLSYNKKNVVPSEHLLENSEIWIFANSTSDSVTTLKADGETFLVKRMADTTSQSKIKSYGWLLSYNKKNVVPSENLVKNRALWIFANSTSDPVTTLKADRETFLVKRMADTTSQSKIKSNWWLLTYNKKNVVPSENLVKNRELWIFRDGAFNRKPLKQSA
jgi:hypothetical protein